MSTIEDVRGILIAGETPEVNGVQIHQDKLGECACLPLPSPLLSIQR